MTIIEQLVEDYKAQNPAATPEQIKEYIQTLEQHTKVIKEDEWAFNTEHDDGIKIPDDISASEEDETFTSGSSNAETDAEVNSGNRTSV